MDFKLKRPCKNCPFRTDCLEGWLGRSRAEEIIDAITTQQQTFSCHATVDYGKFDEDDECGGERAGPAPKGEQHCAGALLMLDQSGAGIGQLARIAERLGKFDLDSVEGADQVFTTLDDFIRHHAGPDEPESAEPCNTVDMDCEAPAGFASGGSAVSNFIEEGLTSPCEGCGEEVCDPCSKEVEGRRLCGSCAEQEEGYEDDE